MPPQLTPAVMEHAAAIADVPSWEDISEIYRSNERRNYKILVTTDALAEEDDVEYKEQILSFGQAVIEMMKEIVPGTQANPTLAPFSRELIMSVVKAFKVGRPLEEALEDGLNQIQSAPPQQQPNPEMIKAQAEVQKAQAEIQKAAMELQMAQSRHQFDMQTQALKTQTEQQELQAKLAKNQGDDGHANADRALKQRQLELDATLRARQIDVDAQMKQTELELKKEQLVLNALEIQLKERQLRAQNEDLTARREMESGVIREKAAKTADAIDQHAVQLAAQQQVAGHADLMRRHAELAHSQNDMGGRLAELHGHVSQAHAAAIEHQARINEALQGLAVHLSQPKRIVRDPKTGRPIGIETVGSESTQGIAAHLNRPKRIVRDPKTGRPIGIETVPEELDH